jgi:hypothetical protein
VPRLVTRKLKFVRGNVDGKLIIEINIHQHCLLISLFEKILNEISVQMMMSLQNCLLLTSSLL